MNKVAIVTGAGRGIGKTVAIELAKAGYDVGITYCGSGVQAEDTMEQMSSFGINCASVCVDLSKADDIYPALDKLTQKLGGVDAQINNAGLTQFIPFLDVTPKDFDLTMGVDWRGAYFCTQFAAKNMIARGVKGSIINITSVHTRYNFPIASMYAPNKSALLKFTRHAALELAPYGIRVNSVAPGYIKVTDPSIVTERERMMVSRIPAGRIGQPEEIASMIKFLISDEAEYITGSDFLVDGGACLPACLDNTYFK